MPRLKIEGLSAFAPWAKGSALPNGSVGAGLRLVQGNRLLAELYPPRPEGFGAKITGPEQFQGWIIEPGFHGLTSSLRFAPGPVGTYWVQDGPWGVGG